MQWFGVLYSSAEDWLWEKNIWLCLLESRISSFLRCSLWHPTGSRTRCRAAQRVSPSAVCITVAFHCSSSTSNGISHVLHISVLVWGGRQLQRMHKSPGAHVKVLQGMNPQKPLCGGYCTSRESWSWDKSLSSGSEPIAQLELRHFCPQMLLLDCAFVYHKLQRTTLTWAVLSLISAPCCSGGSHST